MVITMVGMAATLDTIAEQPGVEAARAKSLHQVTFLFSICRYWTYLDFIHWTDPDHLIWLSCIWMWMMDEYIFRIRH